jgi:competence CoiA-like predicted nuclease
VILIIAEYEHIAQACQAKIAFVTRQDSAGELEIQQRTFRFSKEHSDSELRLDIQKQKIQIQRSATYVCHMYY